MFESIPSVQPSNTKKNWFRFLGLTVLAGISAGLYLLASSANLGIGFPLDDAWIHQTYARNLTTGGGWAFIPGEPTAGSTAPLWTLILAAGYLLQLSPFTWAFCLGILLLGILAYLVDRGVRSFTQGTPFIFPMAGLLIAFEFHFAWSAVSGMETLLHALLIVSICLLLLRDNPPWLLLGLLCGVSTWIRPDGVTLVAPILLTAVITRTDWWTRLRSCAWIIIGFLILFSPYLYFNYSLSGHIFPTTFYAKQAEYLNWQAGPILERSVDFLLNFLTGPAVILVPGFVIEARDAIQKRRWAHLLMMLWMIGYVGLYMMRLPAYQHGRYLVPAMPVFFLFSLMGFFKFLKDARQNTRFQRLIRSAWTSAIILLCAGFWFLGMRAYTSDVEFIETEMVDTAEWVSKNLPTNAVVAAHDIGALGYFDTHIPGRPGGNHLAGGDSIHAG